MPFTAVYRFPDIVPPGRAYLHDEGIEAFGGRRSAAFRAGMILEESLMKESNFPRFLEEFDYLLAKIWGAKTGDKMLTFFGFKARKEWKDDPSVCAWVLRNGFYHMEERDLATGDMMIVLGQEEEYRRTTRNLEEYLHGKPNSVYTTGLTEVNLTRIS
jgi:hypothetical protein